MAVVSQATVFLSLKLCSPSVMRVILCLFVFLSVASGEDVMEFLNGTKLTGTVVEIHKKTREVEFEATIAGKTSKQRYPYAKIHAVTWKGKRYEVTPMPAAEKPFVADPNKKRSNAEVKELIAKIGATDPDWMAETPLDFPDTLDLSWPMPAPKPWNNRKNMGQYIWDRINPNESRWQGGVKLMKHLLETQSKKGDFEERVQKSIGGMYFRFFQDYPRAAYWWEKAGVKSGDENSVGLAECYWRMGNQKMAKDMLGSRVLRLGKIKLLGDMGETREALRLADSYTGRVKEPHEAFLIAADVARKAGDFKKALAYYQKVIDLPKMQNESYDERHRGRAQASIDNIKQFELLDLKKVPNGTHTAESLGYEGPVEVAVSVDAGRITKVEVTQHKEKQFYSALRDTTEQIVAKQNLKDIDTTSRATITSAAIINAAAKALAEAQP